MNGNAGTVEKNLVAKEGRYAVRVDRMQGLKCIKPENLNLKQTIGAVIVPPTGDIYCKEYPIRKLKDLVDAKKEDISIPASPYYHFYNRRGEGDIGWMNVTLHDMFHGLPENENLTRLGWNRTNATRVHGPVIVMFSGDGRYGDTTFYEPYDIGIVKTLLTELAEARTTGHPTRDRIARGDYRTFPKMPGILSRFNA